MLIAASEQANESMLLSIDHSIHSYDEGMIDVSYRSIMVQLIGIGIGIVISGESYIKLVYVYAVIT